MRIIGQVFEEENYDCFRRLPDNRDVVSARINKLIASIKDRYVINPIIVNEKMEIIDGQGRFEACKALGKPIHYIISPGASSEDCRRMNKYNTKWSRLDFAKSFAKGGVQSYQLLLLTCKKTSLSISRVLRLSNHSGPGLKKDNEMNNFECGALKFDQNDMEMVIDVSKMAEEILEALQFTARANDAFYSAVKVMTEAKGYDHNRMIRNCKQQKNSYSQMSQLGAQLVEMERIYNYNSRTNSRLYFSDYMRNKGANARDYSKGYSVYEDTDVSTLKEDN